MQVYTSSIHAYVRANDGLNSDLWIGYKSYIGSILVHRDCIQVNASWIGYKCHNSRPYNRDRIHCQYELNASVISGLNI